MIVVSDTSPLAALMTVGEERILQQLFSEVIIPAEVQSGLSKSHASLPDWIRVKSVNNTAEADRLAMVIDKGEAAGIELAKELRADRLLIDERKGRRVAVEEGVPVIGCLASSFWRSELV